MELTFSFEKWRGSVLFWKHVFIYFIHPETIVMDLSISFEKWKEPILLLTNTHK